MKTIPLSILLAALLGFVAEELFFSADVAAAKEDPICSPLPFFDLYQQHDAAHYDAAGNLILNLRVDLHAPDCGAPDCYGHDMEIAVTLARHGDECRIAQAVSTNTTFTCAGDVGKKLVAGIPSKNIFIPAGTPNLSDPQCYEVILYDREHNQALFLRRDGYAFYEQGLPTEEEKDLSKWDGESEWNFPATGSAARFWSSQQSAVSSQQSAAKRIGFSWEGYRGFAERQIFRHLCEPSCSLCLCGFLHGYDDTRPRHSPTSTNEQ